MKLSTLPLFNLWKREENKMTDNKKKILDMLAKGKISVDEAQRLLNAIDAREDGRDEKRRDSSTGRGPDEKLKAKYLRVTIVSGEERHEWEHGKPPDRINVRVPMSLIRAGIKLTSLIPPEALEKTNKALHEKGIDFDVRDIKPEDIENIIDALGDAEIDIDGAHGEKVKVFVE
jgi:hypothetical protein